jgi:uncharacterized damage-inducible protein DinB
MTSPVDRYRVFANYNAWANRAIYDAVATLSDADYRADRKAFFGSLRGTLNHLLVGDRIWMHRMTSVGETYTQLNLILFDDLASLRAARESEDARIIAFADLLTDPALDEQLVYRNTTGAGFCQALSTVLDHFFNHQTHHRGQAHALLSAAGVTPPSLDLLVFQRAVGVCTPA